GVTVAGFWTVLAAGATANRAGAFALMVVAGGAGLALMIDASQSLGQLSGALAMTCAACFVASFASARAGFGQVATGTALLLLSGLLVSAHVYAEFSLTYVVLLVAGLLGGAVPALLRLGGRGKHTMFGAGAATLVAGIPVLIAIALVLRAAQESGGY
ncbi:MAG TPA: hypothetical protein VM406_00585, partial [Noviherbaspirillum sp.]|nr:hypothetical protein [Noviherbaspirillum sp.]